jgi:PEP-CTERM motif
MKLATSSNNDFYANNMAVTVPEPATWALLAFSLTTVVVLRRRRS